MNAAFRAGSRQYFVLGSAQLAVGAAAIFARFALGGAHPVAIAAWRLTIAAAVLLAIAAFRNGAASTRDARSAILRQAQDDKRRRAIFFAAGLALAVHFSAWIASLQYTSVAVSTLLVATTPIWTALYDSFVRKRRLATLAWCALAIGMAGLVLVVGFSTTRPPIPGHQALGGGLALLGAFAIGAYFLLVREVRHTFSTRAIVTRTYTWAAVVLLIAALGMRQGPPPLSDGTAWFGILAMALISQLLGHTALNASLRWFSASAVAFATLLEPIIAGVLALLIFGEALTHTALAGGALVLIAIAGFLREESRAGDAAPVIPPA